MVIVEIKPFTPTGVSDGVIQLSVYEEGAQSLIAQGNWKLILLLYD